MTGKTTLRRRCSVAMQVNPREDADFEVQRVRLTRLKFKSCCAPLPEYTTVGSDAGTVADVSMCLKCLKFSVPISHRDKLLDVLPKLTSKRGLDS